MLLTIVIGISPLAVFAAPTAASSIRGVVYQPDFRTPVADLAIQVFAEGTAEPLVKTSTDAKGRFRLADLPEGNYMLLLRDETGEPVAKAPITARAGQSSDVTLALPGAGENATAPASAGTFLSGPLGATLALVGTAVIVAVVGDELTDDNPEREDLEPPSEVQP